MVARPEGNGFIGRHVHWDGYPEWMGHQLWEAYQQFAVMTGVDPVQALRDYVLREGQSGQWENFISPGLAAIEEAQPDRFCGNCGGADPNSGCDPEGFLATYKHVTWIASDCGMCASTDDDVAVWVYVIEEEHLTILYACAPSWNVEVDGWPLVGRFPWAGSEPDWEQLRRKSDLGAQAKSPTLSVGD